jgi:hypothetical protein
LTGEENIYQTETFVKGQQEELNSEGKETYLRKLREDNKKSKCLEK